MSIVLNKSKEDPNKKVTENNVILSLALSPTGLLHLFRNSENPEYVPKSVLEQIQSVFELDFPIAHLRLGLMNFEDINLPISFSFWRQFAQIFILEVCKHHDSDGDGGKSTYIPGTILPEETINDFINQAPFIQGIEYFNLDLAKILWTNLENALIEELKSFNGELNTYLSSFHSSWNTVGKVCFHLAENKTNEEYPFAFLATYTTSLSKNAQTQHLPLGKALEEYASKSKKSLLLSLLLPVHRAAEKSIFLKEMVDTGKVFKPLAWKPSDAHKFLKEIPLLEAAGIIIRVPNWWNVAKPPRPSIKVTIGKQNASQVGLGALLDFDLNFSLPTGEQLTEQEFKKLINSTQQLIQIKGQWVLLDSDKLNQVLSHWKSIENKVKKQGLSFAEGLRLLSGISEQKAIDISSEEISTWSKITEGDWVRSTLNQLRNPDQSSEKNVHSILKKHLKAELRPYQETGVKWLWWLYCMRLGGCLADDMGLGKTIQLISLLLLIKNNKSNQQPHLLVIPASLIANWQSEISRFAPSLSTSIIHRSSNNSINKLEEKPDLLNSDLIITTYSMLNRLLWFREVSWDLVILDEAQAIKNPSSKQTQAIKSLSANVRYIMTGTPIENRLLDLWSLFDFIAPGLLGSSKAFADYSKQKSKKKKDNNETHGQFHAAIRKLVKPYILRRLKSDKSIINDLPDKTEMQAYCNLTKQQVGFYQQSVNELREKLNQPIDAINRRGLVMSYLLRFKQICNHPNQYLGHGQFSPELSGKFLRLKEICEVISEKQEKVLIFTQFREIIPALCEYLTQIFGREGHFLHGQTPVNERAKRVAEFQQEQGPPFFVLSLKAGGTGLNLTTASHVIHFDRWWNPAVENQATDRAFRIGQKKNVLVHKFICQGTIEEHIDKLILSKVSLSNDIIGNENEVVLTELSDDELLNIVSLDIHRALEEN